MKEEDFYRKEENERFKLFLEKCGHLYKNQFLADRQYLNDTLIKKKIIRDINNHDIYYELINNLIEEPEFKEKMKYLFYNERLKAENAFSSFKTGVDICRNRFEELEKINDYLNSFFFD